MSIGIGESRIWANELQPPTTGFGEATAAALKVSGLPCWDVDGGFQYFNPNTQFLSYCLISLLGGAVSVLLIGPIVFRIVELSRQERGHFTVFGVLTRLFSLVVAILRLTYVFLANRSPTDIEWTVIGVGAFAALLHYVQDGRVHVCSSTLLFYWLFMSFVDVSGAICGWLEAPDYAVWPLVAIAILSVTILIMEANNPQRGNVPGERVQFDRVSIFEKISLSYVTPLLQRGAKIGPGEKLEREEIPAPPSELSALNCYDILCRSLDKFDPKNRYKVILSVLRMLKSKILLLTVVDSLSETSSYVVPSILRLFLDSLQTYQSGETPLFHSFYYAILMGFFPIVSLSLSTIVELMSSYTYVVSRTSLLSLIYRKALRLSPKAREEYDSAKIMNLLNIDTEQIDSMAQCLPNLISCPAALVVSTYQLWNFIGSTMFVAMAFYIVYVPYTGWASSKLSALYPEMMVAKDDRTKATSNSFRNIKSLKLYAWEKPFYDRIAAIRSSKELPLLRKAQIMNSGLSASWNCLGDLVAAAIFVSLLYLHMGPLSPGIIFPSLLLLQYVTAPFMLLPWTVVSITRAMTSQTRIFDFLAQEDIDSANYYRLPSASGFHEETISAENVTVSWNGETEEDKVPLKNLTFSATHGDLVCIIGRVGSGKTAMLKAIAGELAILDGSLSLKGSLAYCSQESWLQNASIKDNILFGKTLDDDFYRKTLEACDLISDIENFTDKDETLVGERGISLSGGQKARVALARAVYSRSDVYLLDDVLSAVDEHVSAHLVANLFSHSGLLSNKTIILATNNVKVLSHASSILALQDKSIVEKVSFKEIVSNKEESVTYRLIKEFGKADDLAREAHEIEDRKVAISRTSSSSNLHPEAVIDVAETSKILSRKSEDDEDTEKAESVSLWIFKRYFETIPIWYGIAALVIMIVSVFVTNGISIWLGIMSNHNFENLHDAKLYLIVYITITTVSAILIFISSVWSGVVVAIMISERLHDMMLWNLIHAPMKFFDVTPLGRLINRFTGDLSSVDQSLPTMLYYVVRSLINTIMGLFTVLAGSPVLILVVIPLVIVGDNYRRLYIPSSRHLNRMVSAANSPILSHIEESIKGAAIVRSFDRTNQFIDVYDHRVDYWIDLSFLSMNLRRWLTFRIRLMTSTLQLAAAISLTLLVSQNRISVGYSAVVLHFASRVGVMVQQTLAMLAQLEVNSVSLDRLFEYIDIDQEAPPHIAETEPESDWPKSGTISFDNYSTRYKSEGPDVLKSLSLSIQPHEKVGIVGRTGSGKSTLTLSLFRLIEASKGHINIDSVDTSTLGLSDLRSRLCIIPQDAQIFNGTLRENLDPLETVDDARLWEILELCSLKEHFSRLGTGLDTALVDGGDNLSRGQAQLVCLGRALVHDTQILVLDEATASVDVETDQIVQKTIRSEFKDRTIVTIAHRLNTIMDSDRILVLDKGEIKEFDTPERLLEQKGFFWSLANSEEVQNGEPIDNA